MSMHKSGRNDTKNPGASLDKATPIRYLREYVEQVQAGLLPKRTVNPLFDWEEEKKEELSETSGGMPDAEALARKFHDTYERLASQFGYETREDTKQFDPMSPNGRLMIAVCASLAGAGEVVLQELTDDILDRAVDAWFENGAGADMANYRRRMRAAFSAARAYGKQCAEAVLKGAQ